MAKVCDDCKMKTPLPSSESVETFESSQEGGDASSDHEVLHQLESLEPINQCLSVIGETPIAKKKLQNIKYRKQKLKKI